MLESEHRGKGGENLEGIKNEDREWSKAEARVRKLKRADGEETGEDDLNIWAQTAAAQTAAAQARICAETHSKYLLYCFI